MAPGQGQRASREAAHEEQQLRIQSDKIIKELHDLHKELKGGFERVTAAIDRAGESFRMHSASAALQAPFGTYMPQMMAAPQPYAAPAPPPPTAAEVHHHHRSSERHPASPHRHASEEDLDEILRQQAPVGV